MFSSKVVVDAEKQEALQMNLARFKEVFVAPAYGPWWNQKSILKVESHDSETGEITCRCVAGENFGKRSTEHINFVRLIPRGEPWNELADMFHYWDEVQGRQIQQKPPVKEKR